MWSCNHIDSAHGTVNGEPAKLVITWNDPVSVSTVPVFVVNITDPDGVIVGIVLSPEQFELFTGYAVSALDDQRRKFGYDEAPAFDARTIRVIQ